jgi:hypothetical protein
MVIRSGQSELSVQVAVQPTKVPLPWQRLVAQSAARAQGCSTSTQTRVVPEAVVVGWHAKPAGQSRAVVHSRVQWAGLVVPPE